MQSSEILGFGENLEFWNFPVNKFFSWIAIVKQGHFVAG